MKYKIKYLIENKYYGKVLNLINKITSIPISTIKEILSKPLSDKEIILLLREHFVESKDNSSYIYKSRWDTNQGGNLFQNK